MNRAMARSLGQSLTKTPPWEGDEGVAMFQSFSFIVVVLFGTKKLRNIGSDLGAAMKSFKKSSREDTTTEKNIDDNNKKT